MNDAPQRTLGRPKIFRSATELERHILKYFAECEIKEKPYTIAGLASSLGISRNTLHQYGKREDFRDVIKGAVTHIEASVESIMLQGKAQAGSIFWLKNHGWHDKREIDVNDISKMSRDELLEKVKSLAGISLAAKPKTVTESAKEYA